LTQEEEHTMTEQEQRRYVAAIALQFQYFLGQRERGRLLTDAEMAQARENVEHFISWYFGDGVVTTARPAYPERGE
jgi:hypothetical protein